MSEKLFVRGGIVFIIFTLPLMALWEVRTDPARSPEGISATAVEVAKCKAWLREYGEDVMQGVELRRIRDNMINGRGNPKYYPEDQLTWIAKSLENRPARYLYDVRCIRLLGKIKAHLKALAELQAEKII